MVLNNLSLNRALLYARTIRHLRLRQILWRLRSRRARAKIPVAPTTPPELDIEGLDRLREHLAAKADLLGTRHAEPPKHAVFLNQAAPLDYGTPWHDTIRPLLWHYQLHAFRHMDPLISPGNAHGAALLDEIHDWIRYNPPGSRPGWDPYPLSCRLIRWVCAEACHRYDDIEMRRSAHQQALYLANNIEYDVDGNHLLKNLLALAIYGAVADPILWKQYEPLRIYEIGEQVLPDGMQYERSPMYHAMVLEDLLLADVVPPAFALRGLSPAKVTAMTIAMGTVCHPDGEVAIFGDTVFEEALRAQTLLELAWGHWLAREDPGHGTELTKDPPHESVEIEGYSQTRALSELTHSGALPKAGFYVLRPEGTGHHLIAKAGAPGPAHQLGHAHSDPLSFELSVEALRIVVDSGTHGYAESPLREYCRSVRAHNTVCVNGHEPLETWDTFRVARRYETPEVRLYLDSLQQRATNLELPPGLREGELCALRASYRGYQGYEHARDIAWREGAWRIVDTVATKRRIDAESYLHFHPECRVCRHEDGKSFRVDREGVHLLVRPLHVESRELVAGREDPPQGWYCPHFGEAFPAPTLVFRASGIGRVVFGYDIVPFHPQEP